MTYAPTNWANSPSTTTPVSAANLNNIESGIVGLDKLTTKGDLFTQNPSGTYLRLGIGSTGNVLTVASGLPSWAAPAVTPPDVLTTKGDLLTQSADGTYSRLGIGTAGQMLLVVSGLPAWVAVSGPTPATTLPVSPINNQRAILTDSTSSPTYEWEFQYSTAATAWLFVGGSPAIVGPNSHTALSAANTGAVSPFTLPRAGTYIQKVSIRKVNVFAGNTATLNVFDGTTANPVADGGSGGDMTASLNGRPYTWTGKSASDVLSARGDNTGGGTITFTDMVNEILPVKVT